MLGPGTQVLGQLATLPEELRDALSSLGAKPSANRLREVVVALCELRWWTPRELASVLGLRDVGNLSRKHLWPLVAEGKLKRRYPDTPAHPQQAYRATGTEA